MSGLQRILIVLVLVISGVIGFFGWGQPTIQNLQAPKVIGDYVMQACELASNKSLEAQAQNLQEDWEAMVTEVSLGYPISRLNFVQDQKLAQQKCEQAKELATQLETGDNVELYKIAVKLQKANLTEGKKRQDAEFDAASACLEWLLLLKEAEQVFPEHVYSWQAKQYSQQASWAFCSFYAEQALIQYGPLPTPTE